MQQISIDKTSGTNGADIPINVTPIAWYGRLGTSNKVVIKNADDPTVKKETTANIAGAGSKTTERVVKVNGVSKTVNAATGIAENVLFTKDINEIIFSGKSNAQSIGVMGTPVANSVLTIKIDPLGGTAYKYLKQDGTLSDTLVTIPWSGLVGTSYPIASDPGATGYYSFEISGIKVKANDLAVVRNVEIGFIGVDAADTIGVSGTQAGAAPTISVDKTVLNFTPGNLTPQTIYVTTNGNWTAEIV